MKKLQLKKEVIESLDNVEQMRVRGGDVSGIGDGLLFSLLMSCIADCKTGRPNPGGPGDPKTNADMISCKDVPPYENTAIRPLTEGYCN